MSRTRLFRAAVALVLTVAVSALSPSQRGAALALTGESTAALKAQLLRTAAGTSNGVRADARTAATVAAIADELERRVDDKIGFPPLDGAHDLVFCDSSGASSGKIGPFVGDVTQVFQDEVAFVNAVKLGPLEIALAAERKPIDARRYRVAFREMTFSLFGVDLFTKPTKGGGEWKVRYCDEDLRVMAVPSLFVLARRKTAAVGLVDVLRDPARFLEDDD